MFYLTQYILFKRTVRENLALKLTREHNQSDPKDHFISDYINWQGDNQTTSSCRMTARVTTTGTRLGTTQKS